MPAGINETLLRDGGINRFGGPKYRMVWGYARLEFVGGQWEDGFIGFRPLPKYSPPNRFHLEYWVEPEAYGSPTQWREYTSKVINGVAYQTLGDYPSRGEYEHLWECSTPAGNFLEPTTSMMEYFVKVHRKSIERSHVEMAQQRKEREDAKRKDYEVKRDDLLGEAGDKFMSQAVKGRTIKEVKDELEALAPANHARPSVAALKRAS